MKKYSQLTECQRYQIAALKKAEKNQKEIAEIVCVSCATISRELKRNTGKRGYRPKQANIKAVNRREGAVKAVKMTDDLERIINAKIQQEWSPEQISGWLNLKENIQLSHERIYQHIWADKRNGGELYKHLDSSNKRKHNHNRADYNKTLNCCNFAKYRYYACFHTITPCPLRYD